MGKIHHTHKQIISQEFILLPDDVHSEKGLFRFAVFRFFRSLNEFSGDTHMLYYGGTWAGGIKGEVGGGDR